MKETIRRLLPEGLLLLYHRFWANLGAWVYRHPTRTLIVIGVTGTKGKSTTCNFLWAGLTGAGLNVAQTGTANFRIGQHEEMNEWHMTMPGRFVLQKFFRKCVNEGVDLLIVETTSEGIKQHRHDGIDYDMLVFTNLTPEHLPSHGTFERYRAAKQTIFQELAQSYRKTLDGRAIPKVIISNADSPESLNFAKFRADVHMTTGVDAEADIHAEAIEETPDGVGFTVSGQQVHLVIPGRFNVGNALPSFAVAKVLELPFASVARGLGNLKRIPGRMEVLQRDPFVVIVDYAHEKESMTVALNAANGMTRDGGHVIVLLGAEGGGRDPRKRPVMGRIAAHKASVVVVSNVDPYSDDPKPIIDDIADAAVKAGKTDEQDLFRIEDRRQGIRKCLELAGVGDVVLITGKGAEQSIIIGGKSAPWDDRTVVQEELARIKH